MAAMLLFQLADASMLPMVGVDIARSLGQDAALWMSGLLIIPQVVLAILAPWVGFHSEKRGRRPLLLIGFILEPLRAFMLAATAAYPVVAIAQGLSGLTGAVIGVLTVIVVADLTAGTGRFNLALGALGTINAIAASRLHLSGARAAVWLPSARGRSHRRDRAAVGVPHRDEAREVRGLRQLATILALVLAKAPTHRPRK